MKRPGPLLKMTLALVALCGALIVLADFFFGVVPNRAAQTRELRKNVAEALAVQTATLLEADDRRSLQRTLDQVAARSELVLSLGIRSADGELVMHTGNHASVWRGVEGAGSRLDEVNVPLNAGGQRWGSFEVAFKPSPAHPFVQWLREPLVVMLLFLMTFGTLVFGLYVRRALYSLDPASVIPERVKSAFDAMGEGVVVLDARGRMLLANQVFEKLHVQTETKPLQLLGHALSRLSWLATALPSDLSTHPWSRAMATRAANAGQTIELVDGNAVARRLVVNCAPITDPRGRVRGCMVTFSDVSELHRTNEALVVALAELSAAKDEVQAKNEELKSLATRDPLTGCLNRRSFNEELATMFEQARLQGMLLSCVMLDIDHFKKVNDSFGHGVGDRVIQEVAKKVHESARSGDLVCRYGGEEFCVIVPGLDLPQAMAFAERVRAKVEQECAAALRDVAGLQVRISLGVDVLTDDVATPAALIDRADQGLYRAKRNGRNQVCAFSPEEASPTVAQL
jgi:diguanylate cyclase (GGDEF)-like protein